MGVIEIDVLQCLIDSLIEMKYTDFDQNVNMQDIEDIVNDVAMLVDYDFDEIMNIFNEVYGNSNMSLFDLLNLKKVQKLTDKLNELDDFNKGDNIL